MAILQLCARNDSTIRDLAALISTDATLSARLLKFANSPMSGIGRSVTSLEQAAKLLGFRGVQVIALGFSLASGRFAPGCAGFELKRFWTESFIHALTAKHLAKRSGDCDPDEAFTASLLSDLGRLVMAYAAPDDYRCVLSAVERGQELAAAERSIFGLDHLQFGADLLTHWGLPARLVSIIRYLDQPQNAPGAVCVCTKVCGDAARLAPLFGPLERGLPPEVLRGARELVEGDMRFSTAEWNSLAAAVINGSRELGALLNIEIENATDLYAQAHKEATKLAMTQQFEQARLLKEQANLLERASTDDLTGVANRAKFDEYLNEALKLARRNGDKRFAVLLVDVDHFKQINDTFGHAAGDLVLTVIARTLTSTLREVDLLARYGGDEFVILAKDLDASGVAIMAQRIVSSMRNLRPLGKDVAITISVGAALCSDFTDMPDAPRLIEAADKQLYRAKTSGRNTWSSLDRGSSSLNDAA